MGKKTTAAINSHKVGRPRKYNNDAIKISIWRKRASLDKRRIELSINHSASWRLEALAQEWDVSRSAVIERLIMEADERYQNILFPGEIK